MDFKVKIVKNLMMRFFWDTLYLESAPSPMCLQSVILESKRTLEVPERSLGAFWDGWCLKDTSRKLHINVQVSTCLGSAPSPMCLQNVIIESKRTLEVPTGVLEVLGILDAPRIHQGSYISISKSLPSWKVVQLLGSPDCHPSVLLGV